MIRCETRDGLCIARLDSPPLNAITLSDLADLGSAIRLAVQEPGVRGVVLTGSPEHFRRWSRYWHFSANPHGGRRRGDLPAVSAGAARAGGLFQAGGCRFGGRCYGRRPGTSDGVPLSHRYEQEPFQHAGGRLGDQSRSWRHAAIAASGRRFPGDRDAPVGQIAGCRRGDCGRSDRFGLRQFPRHRARSLARRVGWASKDSSAGSQACRPRGLRDGPPGGRVPRARKCDGKSSRPEKSSKP